MSILHAPPAEKEVPADVFLRRRIFSSSIFHLLASAILCADAHAGIIHWGSVGYVDNADSKGRAWDAGYVMTIGRFRADFTPTYENREHWTAAWKELGQAVYDVEERRFAGTVDIDAHELPSGTKIYIWARNGDDLTKGPEWVLMTNNTWKWPSISPSITPTAVWTTGEASISLIVGDTGRNGKHLISRTLRPQPITEATWLAEHFGEDRESMAADLDPDGDGLPNALEYFLGTDPKDPASSGSPVMEATSKEVRLKLARNPYAESDYILEASDNLNTWYPVSHGLLTDRPDLLETSIPKDPATPTRFFRFTLKPAVK